MQLIKYGAAMSFAFKHERNELAIFRRCCSAANLWVLTLLRLSIIRGLIHCMSLMAQILGARAPGAQEHLRFVSEQQLEM